VCRGVLLHVACCCVSYLGACLTQHEQHRAGQCTAYLPQLAKYDQNLHVWVSHTNTHTRTHARTHTHTRTHTYTHTKEQDRTGTETKVETWEGTSVSNRELSHANTRKHTHTRTKRMQTQVPAHTQTAYTRCVCVCDNVCVCVCVCVWHHSTYRAGHEVAKHQDDRIEGTRR
jgi:hypothetical protein